MNASARTKAPLSGTNRPTQRMRTGRSLEVGERFAPTARNLSSIPRWITTSAAGSKGFSRRFPVVTIGETNPRLIDAAPEGTAALLGKDIVQSVKNANSLDLGAGF